MDQGIVAGIGNIYSDEILFQARINPAARVETLTPTQIKRVFLTMRDVLKTAIAHGAGSELFVERDAQRCSFARAQEGRSLPSLRIASEGLQSWRSHSVLLSAMSNVLADSPWRAIGWLVPY